MTHPGHGECVVLLELHCRAPDCQGKFLICTHCYRGQCYCGPHCRTRARAQQLRAANARHQRSEPGRLDHNERQRAYRERLRARRATTPVTYPSSLAPDSAPSCGHDDPSPLPPHSPAPRTTCRPRTRALPPLRCCICGRPGFTARFWRLYCRLYWRIRTYQPGAP